MVDLFRSPTVPSLVVRNLKGEKGGIGWMGAQQKIWNGFF